MRIRNIFILVALTISISALGEEDKKKQAQELGMKAIKTMDAGNIDEAIILLEEAEILDPQSIHYPYEIAYAHYLNKDYKKAIEILKKLTKHPQVNDRIYQMLGNACDLDGDREKAIKVYDLGLKKYPKSGILYLERGNMEYAKENDQGALEYYEKGIQADPRFPSNYYWASKLYMNTTEKVWGMLYGEVFINLERGSKRTAEISKLLYDTYKSQIQFKDEDSFSIDFSRNSTITITPGADPKDIKLPFAIGLYEPLLALSASGEKQIDPDSLHRIREKFLTLYFGKEHYKKYPNTLFMYQRSIGKAGHLEAYNHWLLMKGDEEAFEKWHKSNSSKFDGFVKWYGDHPIEINSKNKVHSAQYD